MWYCSVVIVSVITDGSYQNAMLTKFCRMCVVQYLSGRQCDSNTNAKDAIVLIRTPAVYSKQWPLDKAMRLGAVPMPYCLCPPEAMAAHIYSDLPEGAFIYSFVLRVTTNKLLAKCSLKDEMDETCGSQCTVQGKPESKRPVVGHRRILQNNIKTGIK